MRHLALLFLLAAAAGRASGAAPSFEPKAVQWIRGHTRNLELLNEAHRVQLYYAASAFFPLIERIDEQEEHYRRYHQRRGQPMFVKEGVTIVILPRDQLQTDLPELAPIRGKRVRDVYPGFQDDSSGNRIVDRIRGEGSHRFLVIPQEAAGTRVTGGYSTIYHEFAHFIHLSALTEPQVERIEALYAYAKKRGRFLDYYAATTEREYFAQGVEAYLSETKPHERDDGYMSGRWELATKDPALHEFIRSLLARP